MPSDSQQLELIRSQALQSMADLTARPKPSYVIDGQSISWNEYLEQLRQTVSWVDRQLQTRQPLEIHTLGSTP
jgi:hypothetical protein